MRPAARPSAAIASSRLLAADNQITDAGAIVLAAAIRANKAHGGKLTTFEFNDNRFTKTGEMALAEAMHDANLETDQYTPAAVKAMMSELKIQDADETHGLAEAMTKIAAELKKREYLQAAIDYRNRM